MTENFAKGITGATMSLAIAVAVYVTHSASPLWALLIVLMLF